MEEFVVLTYLWWHFITGSSGFLPLHTYDKVTRVHSNV